jgi:hypothetical protein
MKLFRRRSRVDEPYVSIIDAMNQLNDKPAPYGGDFPVDRIYYPANPPSRQARPELHITQPLRRPPVRRPRRGRVLLLSRAMLPLFHQTTHALGWSGVMPLPRPGLTWPRAMLAIEAYTDRTSNVICSQTEAARAELWERARDYDMQEAEYRAKRPLRTRRGM